MKRTATKADLDSFLFQTSVKRRRVANEEQKIFSGRIPCMIIVNKTPNALLVNRIKKIMLSGAKSQKQIARECGMR